MDSIKIFNFLNDYINKINASHYNNIINILHYEHPFPIEFNIHNTIKLENKSEDYIFDKYDIIDYVNAVVKIYKTDFAISNFIILCYSYNEFFPKKIISAYLYNSLFMKDIIQSNRIFIYIINDIHKYYKNNNLINKLYTLFKPGLQKIQFISSALILHPELKMKLLFSNINLQTTKINVTHTIHFLVALLSIQYKPEDIFDTIISKEFIIKLCKKEIKLIIDYDPYSCDMEIIKNTKVLINIFIEFYSKILI